MKASVAYLRNPFNFGLDRELKTVGRVRLLSTLDPKWKGKPYICTYNGNVILRADWKKTKVRDGDVVGFVAIPQGGGGGGSQILKIVMLIALAVAVAWIPGANVAALGLVAGSMANIAVAVVVGVVGAFLINMMIPPPKPPSPQSMRDMAASSPVYSVGAQGNQARLSAAIPCVYGRHQLYPDFAAQPYAEYMSNEQYLYQLFCIGQGEYDVESINIEDTPIANFISVETQLVGPGGVVTLFPTGMVNSIEVSGQTPLHGVPLGGFVVNGSGTNISRVLIDVVCPSGLFYSNDNGTLSARTVTFDVHARPVDNAGISLGPYVSIGSSTITEASATPQRRSYSYGLASPGRYQVTLTRTNAIETDIRAKNDLQWVGLRGWIDVTQTYGNVTMLAVKMRADNVLSGQGSRKINVIATRRLNTWDPGAGYSASKVATKSIAWAALDMCRNTEYGAGLADARINRAQLFALSSMHSGRGDWFCGVFDSQLSFWEALTSLCRAGRMIPIMQSGVINFVRDTQQSVHTAMFSGRNIKKGSFKIEYLVPTSDTTDAVEVEYFNEVNWKPSTVLATLSGGTSLRPAKVKLFGVTNRDQAWREGMYIAAQNKYRRKLISFTTELEGHIPSYGDLVAISHDMPSWGQSGEVTASAIDGITNTKFTLSEPVTFEATGAHYIMFRAADGSASGPYVATQSGGTGPISNQVLVVTASLAGFAPYVGGAKERSHFMFGQGALYRQRAKVIGIRPSTNYSISVNCVNEDDAVHAADGGTAPAIVSSGWTLPVVPTIPVIPVGSLLLTSSGTFVAPRISASWGVAVGATNYKVEHSTNGTSYTEVSITSGTTLQLNVPAGANYIRVTPMSADTIGAYIQANITVAGDAVIANSVPPVIDAFAASQGLLVINLDWSNTSYTTNTKNYELYRAAAAVTNPVLATLIATPNYGTNYFTDSNVVTNTTYNYWLRTISKFNTAGVWSARSSASARKVGSADTDGSIVGGSAPDTAPPTSVTSAVATAGLRMVALKWTMPSPDDPTLATVEIWRNTSNSRATATKISEALGEFYIDTNVTIGTPYYYWLRTVDFAGNLGPYSPTTDGGGYTATPAAAGPNDIAANAITATKIAADAVTANAIQAGAVTATKISVVSLAAISANIGAITAGSLNINNKCVIDAAGNVTIKSAASGQRTEILNDVIRVYDAAGTLRVKLGNLA